MYVGQNTTWGGKTDDECVCRDAKFPVVLGCPDPERSDHLNAISDIYFIFFNGEMLIKIRKNGEINEKACKEASRAHDPTGEYGHVTKKPLQNLLLFGRSCPLTVPFITYHMPLVFLFFCVSYLLHNITQECLKFHTQFDTSFASSVLMLVY